MLSANNRLDAGQVCQILKLTASKDLNLEKVMPHSVEGSEAWEIAPIPPFAYGDFDLTGWSPWFGYGKVDALKAVQYAQQLRLSAR